MTIKEKIQTYYPSVWTMEEVNGLLEHNKISLTDYLELFPITEENPMTDELLELFRKAKLNEMRSACNAAIEGGVDVQTSNSGNDTEHFSLDAYDQNNITNMFYSVMAGVSAYPYHADGKKCTTYTKEDIIALYVAAQTAITYHTTYNNMLHALINRTRKAEKLAGFEYGMELPNDLAETMQENLEAAQVQINVIKGSLDGSGVVLD